MQLSWLNEKFAPNLLEHKTAIIECIIEQIKHAVVVGVLLNGHQSFRVPDLVVDDVTHCGVLRNKKQTEMAGIQTFDWQP